VVEAVVPQGPASPAEAPLPARVLATHRALFDALRAHDEGALARLYAPDATVRAGSGLASAHGPAEAAALAKALFTAFPDMKVQWERALQAGDALAVEFAWTGSQAGPLGDRAPSKKRTSACVLLVERFAADGLIRSQRLYFDAEGVRADLDAHSPKPRPFAGLPTSQTVVADHSAAGPGDDAAVRALLQALRRGAYEEARPLADAASTWTDRTRGHATTGKGAVAAWLTFLTRSFPAGRSPLREGWTAGDFVVAEWGAGAGDADADDGAGDAASARVADVIELEAGHLKEVRTYRSTTRPAEAEASRRHGGAGPSKTQ
jgi:ketosteroid isomerase-like protein/predicted ester cyclase